MYFDKSTTLSLKSGMITYDLLFKSLDLGSSGDILFYELFFFKFYFELVLIIILSEVLRDGVCYSDVFLSLGVRLSLFKY